AEHKIYNPGESTRHIDWKLYAKTDKLYTKRYDDETNLRCHIILDNSRSMHYPEMSHLSLTNLNKIGFSVLATADLMQLFKKPRDALGLNVYRPCYTFFAANKSSDRHHYMLIHSLKGLLNTAPGQNNTKTYGYLHLIVEKIHRRNMM